MASKTRQHYIQEERLFNGLLRNEYLYDVILDYYYDQ